MKSVNDIALIMKLRWSCDTNEQICFHFLSKVDSPKGLLKGIRNKQLFSALQSCLIRCYLGKLFYWVVTVSITDNICFHFLSRVDSPTGSTIIYLGKKSNKMMSAMSSTSHKHFEPQPHTTQTDGPSLCPTCHSNNTFSFADMNFSKSTLLVHSGTPPHLQPSPKPC